MDGRPLRVLTWHIHGGYLFYLAHTQCELFVPVKPGRPERFTGLPRGGYPWPGNLHEIPAEAVRDTAFDCVLFQTRENWTEDQEEILSYRQRRLPRLYLEHDPPLETPAETRHVVDDPNVLLVHVTPFNQLMWDSGRTPTRVIEHGVVVPHDVRHSGELERGIVVVNNLGRRGRRLGPDVFEAASAASVPLDLVGLNAPEMGGLDEVPHDRLPAFEARYRFFFNPIRHTSLGLAVCEAMQLGMPIVGLATTEMVTAIENGVSGYVDTRLDRLVERMRELLADPAEARRLGGGARAAARERFGIERFARDWERTFVEAAGRRATPVAAPSARNRSRALVGVAA